MSSSSSTRASRAPRPSCRDRRPSGRPMMSPTELGRVQRGVGELEDDLQRGAAGPWLRSAQVGAPVACPSSRTLPACGGQDAGDDARQRRLAAAGFADHPEVAAALERAADVLTDRGPAGSPSRPHRAVAGGQTLRTASIGFACAASSRGDVRAASVRRPRAVRGCRGGPGRRGLRRSVPVSWTSPPFSTTMRSAIWATTARSWRDVDARYAARAASPT